MELTANIKIHNKFIIERRDKNTNEVLQTGVAENIILDRAYTRVCNFNSYFSNIHFGTGTGEVNPNRVSLFTPLANKSAIIETSLNAYPVSHVTKKITLNPEEYIGKEITEVGISETSAANSLNTHALIKDAEGNLLSIIKTELDVIIIYATVFINFEHPSESFKFIFPNAIAEYFINHSSLPVSIQTGFALSRISGPKNNGQLVFKNSNYTANLAAKTTSISTRFGITEANGNFDNISLLSILSLNIPSAPIYSNTAIQEKEFGVSDGIKNTFNIPIDLQCENIVIKKNGYIVSPSEYTLTLKDFYGAPATPLVVSETPANLFNKFEQVTTNQTIDIEFEESQNFQYLGIWALGTYYSDLGYLTVSAAKKETPKSYSTIGNTAVPGYASTQSTRHKVIDLTSQEYFKFRININKANVYGYYFVEPDPNFITFHVPPIEGDVLTVDYIANYIPKTEDYVLDAKFTIQFGEGV